MASLCDDCKERSLSIKFRELLDSLRDSKLLKKDSAACSEIGRDFCRLYRVTPKNGNF